MNPVPAPIVALSEADIASIKSSTSILCLENVVDGLLSNSLDAAATKVDISIDFAKGNCTVEDNGGGIAQKEFCEDGGLIKSYHSSKLQLCDVHGNHGTFLYALAAMSKLSITSRPSLDEPSNTLISNYSRSVPRLVPAPLHYQPLVTRSGTMVEVRNLFGNMPVRIKERKRLSIDVEILRQWHDVLCKISSLLISWKAPVHVTIREEHSGRTVNFAMTGIRPLPALYSRRVGIVSAGQRLDTMERNLRILTQAGLIEADSWSSWIPVKGSISNLSIEGAISLDPAPSKRVQFVHIGCKPLGLNLDHNEIFDEINRIFSNSCFGVLDDDVLSLDEELRRSKDRRFKQGGFTNKQVKGGRKGIDRWPRFFLQILTKEPIAMSSSGEIGAETSKYFDMVIEVLCKLTTKWLESHHFRPRKWQPRKKFLVQHEQSNFSSGQLSTSTTSRLKPLAEQPDAANSPSCRPSTRDSSGGRKYHPMKVDSASQPLSTLDAVVAHSMHPDNQSALEMWSRIKRGKPVPSAFTTTAESSLRPEHHSVTGELPELLKPTSSAITDSAILDAPTPASMTDSNQQSSIPLDAQVEPPLLGNSAPPEDEVIPWIDPKTAQKMFINTRTGTSYAQDPNDEAVIRPMISSITRLTKVSSHKNMKATPLEASESSGQARVGEMLEKWQNPVFKAPEKNIIRTLEPLEFLEHGNNSLHGGRGPSLHSCKHGFSARITESQLSPAGLRNATVIAQVEKKFILIKMPPLPQPSNTQSIPSLAFAGSTLVIVDQHAADERCKLEELLDDFCTPPAGPLRSRLGHIAGIRSTGLQKSIMFEATLQEAELLVNQAPFFARWGILYHTMDIPPVSGPQTAITKKRVIIISSLPPAIIERATAEPNTIISILRAEAWAQITRPRDSEQVSSPKPTITDPSNSDTLTQPKWLHQIGTCPKPLLDLLLSRACRSAIMFNDVLSIEQCWDLIKRLADCVFPWQCAHGRPSVVPLVSLGELGGRDGSGCLLDVGDWMGFWPEDGGWGPSAVVEKEKDDADAYRRWIRCDILRGAK